MKIHIRFIANMLERACVQGQLIIVFHPTRRILAQLKSFDSAASFEDFLKLNKIRTIKNGGQMPQPVVRAEFETHD